MDVLTNLVVVIISHCMHILNIILYTVHLFQLFLKKIVGERWKKRNPHMTWLSLHIRHSPKYVTFII